MGPHGDGVGKVMCAGRYDGAPCPDAVSVSLCDVDSMRILQMDHEVELALVCETWRTARARMPAPSTWDAGINQAVVLELLFGVEPTPPETTPWVRPRCRKCHRHMPHLRRIPDIVM